MGKRPVIGVTLALLSGLLFSEAFSYFPFTSSLFILFVLLLERILFRRHIIPVCILIVWALGFCLHQGVSTPSSPNALRRYIDQGPVKIVAEVIHPPQHADNYVALQMEAIALFSKNTSHSVHGFLQLYISKPEIPFEYGDQLEMTVQLRRPNQYQNPGAFLYADYRDRIGRHSVARLSHFNRAKKVGSGGNPILKVIFRWRDQLRIKIKTTMNDPSASMLMAMLIGESGYLSEEVREDFTKAGIAHLLAVSGTHLAFVSLFVFGLSRWFLLRLPERLLLKISTLKLPTQWATLPTVFVVIFYTFLAGGKVGTLRALTMILLYMFSIWIGRSRDTQISLAIAALLILLFRPQAIFEISFQLSFIAVLSILVFMEWWEETGADLKTPLPLEGKPPLIQHYILHPLSLLFISSLSAVFGTAPLTIYYFHQLSWVGLFTNLIITPIVGWLYIPIALFSGVLSLLIDAFPFPLWHNQLGSSLYDAVLFFSNVPGADLSLASPPLFGILLFYLTIFSLMIFKKSRRAVFYTTASFFIVFIVWGRLRMPPEKLRVTFLDVGQGDATLIEFPNRKTLLIDGGSPRAGKYALAPYLWQRRIRNIDTMVTTHPQYDHIGGLPFIFKHFNVKEVWTNGHTNTTQTFRLFKKMVLTSGAIEQVITSERSSIHIGECELFFLNPGKIHRIAFGDLNNQSIVFRMVCTGHSSQSISFLFAGDIEVETEEKLIKSRVALKSTVLKVPHHGSRSSSDKAFIREVSPQIALFSVGKNNRYRHPHQEVLSSYERHGTKNYRTDQVGAVFVEVGERLSITTFIEQKLRYIIWNKAILKQEWQNLQKVFS